MATEGFMQGEPVSEMILNIVVDAFLRSWLEDV